jgi:hypothetical protein
MVNAWESGPSAKELTSKQGAVNMNEAHRAERDMDED